MSQTTMSPANESGHIMILQPQNLRQLKEGYRWAVYFGDTRGEICGNLENNKITNVIIPNHPVALVEVRLIIEDDTDTKKIFKILGDHYFAPKDIPTFRSPSVDIDKILKYFLPRDDNKTHLS